MRHLEPFIPPVSWDCPTFKSLMSNDINMRLGALHCHHRVNNDLQLVSTSFRPSESSIYQASTSSDVFAISHSAS